jgi:hypothetical protein
MENNMVRKKVNPSGKAVPLWERKVIAKAFELGVSATKLKKAVEKRVVQAAAESLAKEIEEEIAARKAPKVAVTLPRKDS